MAPIAVKAPTSGKSTTTPYGDKSMKRGRSIKRSSTQRRPQQLSPHFAQAMQMQQSEDEDEDEDEAATISDRPSLQPYRRRERQSYINPRQHMLHLPDSARPATSRSHKRDWSYHRDQSPSPSISKKLPPSDSLAQQPHIESHFSIGTASTGMTSEEFESLPPTIQRKVSRHPRRLHSCHIFFACSFCLTCSKAMGLLQVSIFFQYHFHLARYCFRPAFSIEMCMHIWFQEALVISARDKSSLVRVASNSTRTQGTIIPSG